MYARRWVAPRDMGKLNRTFNVAEVKLHGIAPLRNVVGAW